MKRAYSKFHINEKMVNSEQHVTIKKQ